MPNYTDVAEEMSERAPKQQTAVAYGKGGRGGVVGNGLNAPGGRTVFNSQIEAMEQMVQRLYYFANRVSEAADTVAGPREKTSPGDARIRGNPGTVQQAWDQVVEASDEIERQINRFYE